MLQDYAEAAKWYRKAADGGLGSAQTNLGVLYEKGFGVTQDFAQAALWYRKAAELQAIPLRLRWCNEVGDPDR